jgi:hypothetical protein
LGIVKNVWIIVRHVLIPVLFVNTGRHALYGNFAEKAKNATGWKERQRVKLMNDCHKYGECN